MVKVGDKAPDFTLKMAGQKGLEDFKLSAQRGKNVVLLFYPLVNTPVCFEEMCTLRDDIKSYEGLKAQVVALSVDSPFAQKLWAEKEGFKFPMVSDFNKEVSTSYGAIHDVLGATGLKGVSKRSAFVIDKEGMIRWTWISDDPKVKPDFNTIKAELKKLS
jgi:peroxiredoxin